MSHCKTTPLILTAQVNKGNSSSNLWTSQIQNELLAINKYIYVGKTNHHQLEHSYMFVEISY